MKQSRLMLVGAAVGVGCGFGLALLCGAGGPAAGAPGRFQICDWATSATASSAGNEVRGPDHGAYRLDIQTGDVVAIDANGTASKIAIP